MQPSRSRRIHRGFHRVGAVIAGLVLLIGLALSAVATIEKGSKSKAVGKPKVTSEMLDTAIRNAKAAGDSAAVTRMEGMRAKVSNAEAAYARSQSVLPKEAWQLLGGFAAAGLVAYLLSRAIGWIIAGFLRD